MPGELAAAEQGLPSAPAPFSRQTLNEDLLTARTPEMHQWALERFCAFRNGGQFLPFTVGKDTVIFPGFDGGAEWGGPAVDPETATSTSTPMTLHGLGRWPSATRTAMLALFTKVSAAVCHGQNRAGSPPEFPSLVGITSRLDAETITATIKNGKGRMSGFPNISADQLKALLDYLAAGETKEIESSTPPPPAMKYHLTGYKRFYDPDGYPAVTPPWGTLNAINLNTGEYVWKIPLGEYPALAAQGVTNTGTENYGGPVVTAGGLLFIWRHEF